MPPRNPLQRLQRFATKRRADTPGSDQRSRPSSGGPIRQGHGLPDSAHAPSCLGGIIWSLPVLIFVGSILQGASNSGGQLTWALASSHFAPRAEDVPLCNGIHFVLNDGVRGLVLPWVGAVLFVLTG